MSDAQTQMARRADDLVDRIGFNTASLANRPLAEAARIGRELGFAGIELLSFADYRHSCGDLAGLYFDRLTAEERDTLERVIAPFEHVSVHAPFWDIAPFSPNPGIRDESRRQLRDTTAVSASLGASTVTTHVVARHGYQWPEYRDDVIGLYGELGDLAAEREITVTIETGFPREIDEFTALIHDIDHPAVGANVDVGHLRGLMTPEQQQSGDAAATYNDLLARHIDSLGAKVIHLHLHDTRRSDFRDHREYGTGIIDLTPVFRRLLELDYRGLANFELEEADAVGALRRSRERVIDAIRAAAC